MTKAGKYQRNVRQRNRRIPLPVIALSQSGARPARCRYDGMRVIQERDANNTPTVSYKREGVLSIYTSRGDWLDWFMPGQLRIKYPGAIYHVMNRGDRREPIFQDDTDRKHFIATLGEACRKTDWRIVSC